MTRGWVPVALLVTAVALSGCLRGGSDGFDFTPGTDFRETGRTIHLKATVVDLVDHEIYPGFQANLWAFCFEPFDAADAVSAAAIEPHPPLATDGPAAAGSDGRCGVPGPTLRVRQGDRVIVEFSHSHFHPHTIHWHGQFVPWESDGAPGVTQDTVEPGESFTYDFIAKRAGTLWYHCHVDTQFHVMNGLYGMIIVEPQDDAHEPMDIDREYAWVLSTLRRDLVQAGLHPLHSHPAGCFVSGRPGCMNPPQDITPDVFMINGHSYPHTVLQEGTLLRIAEGERIRLRLLNAGTTVETIHPHGHDMLVTHRDGNPLPEPFWVDTLTLGPAERYDVVIEGGNPGPWMVHTHVNDHETNCGISPGGMHSELVYDGFTHEHEFQAELPAGCPYSFGFVIPDDQLAVRTLFLGTTNAASASWGFGVEEACPAREARFEASLAAATPVGLTLTALTVTLTAPDGAVAATFELGGGGDTEGSWALEGAGLADLRKGNYTVAVSGQAFEATLHLSATVDYYATLTEATAAAHTYGYPTCPGQS